MRFAMLYALVYLFVFVAYGILLVAHAPGKYKVPSYCIAKSASETIQIASSTIDENQQHDDQQLARDN